MTVLHKLAERVFKPDATRRRLAMFKYLGPGLLVTVGFIDPGNWASNLAAGSEYGYTLLWTVTFSTFMLIVLQHNAAHLGIVTGKCLSESITAHFPKYIAVPIMLSALVASVMTSLAEILGGAIALRMLFHIPLQVGAILTVVVTIYLLFFKSYSKLERWIAGFVSLIGLGFLYELFLIPAGWFPAAAIGSFIPEIPQGALFVILSVLGAVVMPHNLFLHSEIIQSRQWNLEGDETIQNQLDSEFLDTIVAMLIGWAINCSMIILAAAVFWTTRTPVTELEQAYQLLHPLLGKEASLIFAVALLMAGVASSVTSGMAGGVMMAGMAGRAYDIREKYSIAGVGLALFAALAIIWFVTDPFQALLMSQVALSIQLPITITALVVLTSSEKVMGKYANGKKTRGLLYVLATLVAVMNIALLVSSV